MKKQMMEKGITLVALVVTIIILLILAGVTLNLALTDNGLFSKTKDAVEKYKKAEEDEENAIGKLANKLEMINIDYNDYVGCFVDGYKPDEKECTITSDTSGVSVGEKYKNENLVEDIYENGDQKIKTETGIKWRIWDYDTNTRTIRLISDKPTDAKLSLKGATGYNNGVWAINEVCRQCYGQYNNDGEMNEGIDVANLRRSDIEKVINYDYTKYSHDPGEIRKDDGTGKYKYGRVYTFPTKTNSCPIMWKNFDSKWKYENIDDNIYYNNEKTCKIWEIEHNYINNKETFDGNGDTQFKQSVWIKEYNSQNADENDWKNISYYNLLFKDKDGKCFDKRYWLACRGTYLLDYGCYFQISNIQSFIDKCLISSFSLYISSTKDNIVESYNLRPIVSINLNSSGYSLEKNIDDEGVISFSLQQVSK